MLLTLELLPLLLRTAASYGDARIIFVTSSLHFLARPFNPDKLSVPDEREYRRMQVYSDTKLYNVRKLRETYREA